MARHQRKRPLPTERRSPASHGRTYLSATATTHFSATPPLPVSAHSSPLHSAAVPAAFRRKVFDTVHGLSQLGANTTVKLVASKFVWHSLSKQVRNWAKTCLDCQPTKVHHHVKAPLRCSPSLHNSSTMSTSTSWDLSHCPRDTPTCSLLTGSPDGQRPSHWPPLTRSPAPERLPATGLLVSVSLATCSQTGEHSSRPTSGCLSPTSSHPATLDHGEPSAGKRPHGTVPPVPQGLTPSPPHLSGLDG